MRHATPTRTALTRTFQEHQRHARDAGEKAAMAARSTIHPDDDGPIAFGRWLLTQRGRGDWVDGIADPARADRSFPRNGDPEAVRAHLRICAASRAMPSPRSTMPKATG
jgi:hypothetical protein